MADDATSSVGSVGGASAADGLSFDSVYGGEPTADVLASVLAAANNPQIRAFDDRSNPELAQAPAWSPYVQQSATYYQPASGQGFYNTYQNAPAGYSLTPQFAQPTAPAQQPATTQPSTANQITTAPSSLYQPAAAYLPYIGQYVSGLQGGTTGGGGGGGTTGGGTYTPTTQTGTTTTGTNQDTATQAYYNNLYNNLQSQIDKLSTQTTKTATPTNYSQLLTQYYADALGRTPDTAGAAYWNAQLNQGATPSAVYQAIANSKEATDAISSAYNQYLGRAPDAAGLQYWQGQMANKNMTLAQVQQAIAQSNEAQAKGSGITSVLANKAANSTAMTPSNGSPPTYAQMAALNQYYQQSLGRAPDTAGAAYWANQLTSGAMTPTQVQQAIANSAEAQSGGVSGAYAQYLGRAPDAEGAAYWNNQISSGAMTPAQVQQAIANSAEAQAYQAGLGSNAYTSTYSPYDIG